jgi:hypothetical protein
VIGEQDQKPDERRRGHNDENRQTRRGVQKSDAGRGECTNAHLQKAKHGRSAADILAEGRERNCRRVGIRHSAERQVEQQQDDIAGKAVPAIERADQNNQHDYVLADDGDAKDLVILMPTRQPNIQLASADEAAGESGEDQAVGLRTDMEAVDENDRRAGHVDEQARKRERAGKRIGIELRADQDLLETFENGEGRFQDLADGPRAAAIRSRSSKGARRRRE